MRVLGISLHWLVVLSMAGCGGGDACIDVDEYLRSKCAMSGSDLEEHNEARASDGSCDDEIAECLLTVLDAEKPEGGPDACHQVIHLGPANDCGSARRD